ncbi:MAG: DUF5996 family protein [Acidiferrobacterales bacterium]
MATDHYPALDDPSITETKNALHAYARILGNWLKHCRAKRKHWWHASLRPSLNGLTTGVVHAEIDFELELNLRESLLQCRTSTGKYLSEKLQGQSASSLADSIEHFLVANGIGKQSIPDKTDSPENTTEYSGYSQDHALIMAEVFNSVSATMNTFRAGIREETSPVQLWPHHFDLSLLWLPGDKIADQDPANEEYADKQMNFGFVLGDEGIAEPYFYITAYPLPEALPRLQLPKGTVWQTEGFNGAVLLYKTLIENSSNPDDYLMELWHSLLKTGRENMMENATEGTLP